MTDATELARGVLRHLVEHGVTDLVVSPGSRNAPLSFAALDLATAGAVRLHTRIDERSAGFLALGLTKVGAQAAVMCTSGTAVANLHPAVLEAAHAGLPLVVVTADRPARLRGTSANQTTDQVGIFGSLVMTHDLDSLPGPGLASGGPTHLNLQLDAPLVPSGRPPTIGHEPPRHAEDPRGWGPIDVPLGPRTVVVAGDDAGPRARQLAERAGWPLLAEPTSGARTGTHALRCYRLLLETDLVRSIERVVVFGHPTVSRPVQQLLARDDVEVVVVRGSGVWSTPPHPVSSYADQLTAEPDDPAWLESWRTADAEASRSLDALLRAEDGLTPHEVVGLVSRSLPRGGLLVVGASSPIRDLDLMAVPYPVGERRKVIANRGLSGIDGTVSTAIGAALGRRDSSRAIALLGDVTFLHDANGLVLGPDEPRPDLTIVVVNDDGGSIFATLEQGAPEFAAGVRTPLRYAARRRPRGAVRGDPHPTLAGRVRARARARARCPQRGDRGDRGARPPRRPKGPRPTDPRVELTVRSPVEMCASTRPC